MSDTLPTWMAADGKVGEVVARLREAREAVAAVRKQKEGKAASAADVFEVAAAALSEAKLVHEFSTRDVTHKDRNALFVSLHISMRVIAPDGTYLAFDAPAGAVAPNSKSTQAAVTSGHKTLLRHALMIRVVDEGEAMPEPAMSKEFRNYLDYLETIESIEDLKLAGAHETCLALADHELKRARDAWRARKETLIELDAASYARWDRSRRMQAVAKERQAQQEASAATDLRDGPRKPPIDLGDTRPVKRRGPKKGPDKP